MGTEAPRARVIPPPLYFLLCLALGGSLHQRRPVELGSYSFQTGMTIGMALLAIAGTLGGWALVVMTRARTPIEPWRSPAHLVTYGPFRFTRNPLYLTLTSILVALSVMANSAWIAGAAVLLPLLLDRFVIVREEDVLTAVFGSEYADYKRRVRRWL